MKPLGQHFLKNKNAVRKIIDSLEIKAGDIVIEVGAGHGELTREIFNAQFSIFKNDDQSGIKIIAIEKDKALAEELARNFQCPIFNFQKDGLKKVSEERFVVMQDDALQVLAPLIKFLNLEIENYKLKIVGNIPYYITGRLLRILSELKNKPDVCVFTLQKEVAERIVARPPKANKLASITQFYAKPKIIGYIPKKDFSPPPKVDAAIIKLDVQEVGLPNGSPTSQTLDADKYFKTVRILFTQPRKTIANNLLAADRRGRRQTDADEKNTLRGSAPAPLDSLASNGVNLLRSAIAEKLSAIGINPQDRPQNLSVEDILKISNL